MELGRYSDGLWAGRPWFDFRQCKIFPFSWASRPTLGSTQPLPNWYRELFLGDKATGAWILPRNSTQYRGQEWWSYISTPPSAFRDIVLKEFSTGTPLLDAGRWSPSSFNRVTSPEVTIRQEVEWAPQPIRTRQKKKFNPCLKSNPEFPVAQSVT
jgi:hypothetical protein